jgi:tRNA threonylcarbamoyladenosine biosynthesis protein TsaB
MVTVMAINHGLAFGFQVSWNESVAAAAAKSCSLPAYRCERIAAQRVVRGSRFSWSDFRVKDAEAPTGIQGWMDGESLCHAGWEMAERKTEGSRKALRDEAVDPAAGPETLLLGVDTCGPAGSVALGRLDAGGAIEILGEIELEGRSYSARLVAAIDELLRGAGLRIRDVSAIVAVHGPGSFTGVRVGLSTVKGLAEVVGMGIVAVSRLEVLAAKAGVKSAALDAHRHEVFLRLERDGEAPTELLAGAAELAALPAPAEIAVGDDGAAALIQAGWQDTRLVQMAAPRAGDALRVAAGRVLAGAFVDSLVLDGHYLRRSDAEIFGERAEAAPARR